MGDEYSGLSWCWFEILRNKEEGMIGKKWKIVLFILIILILNVSFILQANELPPSGGGGENPDPGPGGGYAAGWHVAYYYFDESGYTLFCEDGGLFCDL